MAPSQMVAHLRELPEGQEFDMTYMNYLILMRNNERGMARVAKDKATKLELRQLAQEQFDQNETYVTDLFTKQRTWGFSHH